MYPTTGKVLGLRHGAASAVLGKFCGRGHPKRRHHDTMSVASKRCPVFKHSISEGARSGDDVRAENLYASSSASNNELAQPKGPERLRVR